MKINLRHLFIFIITILSLSITSHSQLKINSGFLGGLPGELTVNGYIDTYIAYDNDKSSNPRQFSSFAPYRDEFRINMGMIALRYTSPKVRGNIALHFGDFAKLNWPQEPNDYMQYIQEANIGVAATKKIWIDAGYFLTHIGGEGAIPKYNFFQTLSLCTYYEPFYQSGIKVSYTGKKFYGALLILNGYNVFADNNKNKSFGVQLGFKPNKRIDITYNNIIGNEMPAGTAGKTRIYNNLVVKLYPSKKVDVVLCGDLCLQEKSKLTDSTSMGNMFSGFLAVKYRAAKHFSIAVRGEIFQDKDAIFTPVFNSATTPLTGLKSSGVSMAVEYDPVDNAYFRLETRYLMTDSEQKIFFDSKNSRSEIILSGGLDF